MSEACCATGDGHNHRAGATTSPAPPGARISWPVLVGGLAILSGGERTRTVQGNSLPVIELQSGQRLAKPVIRLAPRLSCAFHEGCARL